MRWKHWKRMAIGMLLCGGMVFGACKEASEQETALSVTPTSEPVYWLHEMWEQGRTELSHSMQDRDHRNEENYEKVPVSDTKTVRLGDFEFYLNLPKTVYRLEELQNKTDCIKLTMGIRYVGEKESVTIGTGEPPFITGIDHSCGVNHIGASLDSETCTELKPGEELTYVLSCDSASWQITEPGQGRAVSYASFNYYEDEDTEQPEIFEHMLVILFDVVE